MPASFYPVARGIALVQMLLIVVALVLLAGVAYLLLTDQTLESVPTLRPGASSGYTAEPAVPEATARAPVVVGVTDVETKSSPISAPLRPEPVVNLQPQVLAVTVDPSLPDLNHSDSRFRAALAQLDPTQKLISLLVDEELIRKLVVSIDNIADGRLQRKHSLLLPMNDPFRASVKGEEMWLDGYNYSRYSGYVELLSAIDAEQWVGLYRDYYPQMQQAYAELGYPRKAFHDRVLLALEHLLQSPVSGRALALAQPSVMYTFADPELEQLSAVHKQMLRLGPVNARRVLDAVIPLRARLVQLQ
ncbi:MAG: DUF3014 domain-containing protein [Motiliproteus sp.]